MKKTILTFMLAVVGAATMFAQSEPTKMVIVQKDGSTATYQLADIDSIYFQAESTASKVYKIDIPTDFSTGRVQKVMAGDKQVAEICSEYVRSWGVTSNAVDDVLTVVYPMGTDGKADLSKGLASNGASIVWDVEGDSVASYTPGTADLTTIYLTAEGVCVIPARRCRGSGNVAHSLCHQRRAQQDRCPDLQDSEDRRAILDGQQS